VLPLGIMFFFILFDYTILRDTKDVLVVTAPKSGAEIIPFLKTYVNLPGAIGFTVLYSKMTNMFSRSTVFIPQSAPCRSSPCPSCSFCALWLAPRTNDQTDSH